MIPTRKRGSRASDGAVALDPRFRGGIKSRCGRQRRPPPQHNLHTQFADAGAGQIDQAGGVADGLVASAGAAPLALGVAEAAPGDIAGLDLVGVLAGLLLRVSFGIAQIRVLAVEQLLEAGLLVAAAAFVD